MAITLKSTTTQTTTRTVAQSITYQPIYVAGKVSAVEVLQAAPVIGKVDIRTTAIADRLKNPPSTEARDYALATRQQTVRAIVELMQQLMAEDDGVLPGLFKGIKVYGLVRGTARDPFLPAADNFRQLTEFSGNAALQAQLLASPTLATPADEAELFSQTTDYSDNTVALLRQFEANIAAYRNALTRCELALTSLRGAYDATGSRLAAAGDAVAESRHDVSVARALMAEEAARIAAVNARRAKVLTEEVKFLAYMRPREVDNLAAAPTHVVDPGLAEAPVPACLRQHPDLPDALDDLLGVIAEAPADWFVQTPPLVAKLDKPDLLLRALSSAQMRAAAGIVAARTVSRTAAVDKLTTAIASVASRQATTLAPRIAALTSLNLAALAGATWQGVRGQAEQVVSLADLAEGGHGRADVARAAAAELDKLRAMVACLHAGFSATPAALRLVWAETLSEFDAAPNLRNLANLPRWTEIERESRRTLQAWVDWLFGQVQVQRAEAVALVNDVVRMALLLASHAPIDRIVSGHMAQPQTGVTVGVHIPLTTIEPAKLRVGMQALLYRGETLVARAHVADIGAREVTAQVIHTAAAKVDLGTDIRVHFDDAASVSLAGLSAKRSLFGR